MSAALLFCLLTTEANAHVPGWLKWLGELSGWTATFMTIGAAAATLWGLGAAATSGFRKKRAQDLAEANKPVAPTPLPPPSPAALPPQHHYEAELQGMRVRALHTESELVEAQEAMRRLRRALDESAIEHSRSAKALYESRAEVETLRAKSAALLAEMARLRAQGPSTPPPPRPPTLRGARDR